MEVKKEKDKHMEKDVRKGSATGLAFLFFFLYSFPFFQTFTAGRSDAERLADEPEHGEAEELLVTSCSSGIDNSRGDVRSIDSPLHRL